MNLQKYKILKKSVLLGTLLFVMLCLNGIPVFAQYTLTGKIAAKETGLPIPYATVGLVKDNIGITTTEQGVLVCKLIL